MTTLVTGGAGFIGSHLCAVLLEQGEAVVCLDNFNDYYDPAIKRANVARLASLDSPGGQFTLVEGDIRDVETVNAVFETHDVKRVVNLAAMANVRYSIERAPLYVAVNLNGAVNLMEAARRHSVEIFVQASTSSVYGTTAPVPFREDDAADRPLAAYPASKRAAEMMAHSYYHLFGLNVTCLRFFNVYGPAGRPDMMPFRVLDAIVKGKPITLFNGGTMRRDWTYIDDTVAGVAAALARPMGYEVINLGCGAPMPMTEFMEVCQELTGKPATIIDTPAPPSDPPITYCDNTRARERLGFAPKVNTRQGLANTWAWYQETFLRG
ncbi:MAG: SDR family NAD(P)-dependent oxidoreductase [Anaerolineae bacterium]|nr:SDR family NAD(P)-dependent oxidoreductase [Anaerolineae bacterium]